MVRFWRLAVFAAVASTAAVCQDWQTYKPSLVSMTRRLNPVQAARLLSNFCISIDDAKEFGLTCTTRSLGSAFADIMDNQFHPQQVIFGHFLDPASEDAAVSGWSTETHPYHWGGTLLLTLRNRQWTPLWYKSGLIIRSCDRATRPDGREILICEYEDGGMSHRYHVLYPVDLRRRSKSRPLAEADSFESDFCTGQRQMMDAVQWGSQHQSFSVIIRTPEWEKLPDGYCGPHRPHRPPASVRRDFEITADGVQSR